MIYTEMTKKAIKLMFEKHKDQVDKSGMPYVFHPFHLAEQMDDAVGNELIYVENARRVYEREIKNLV